MFRDETPCCPQCKAALDPAGDRFTCTPCASAFLLDRELSKLLDELSPDDARPVARRVYTNNAPGRTCPLCAARMVGCWIHDTGFERCAKHGCWLTTQNLQTLLAEHATQFAARDSDHTKLELFMFIPVIGALSMPVQALMRPWVKRRRLRKYLARSTPQTKR